MRDWLPALSASLFAMGSALFASRALADPTAANIIADHNDASQESRQVAELQIYWTMRGMLSGDDAARSLKISEKHMFCGYRNNWPDAQTSYYMFESEVGQVPSLLNEDYKMAIILALMTNYSCKPIVKIDGTVAEPPQ